MEKFDRQKAREEAEKEWQEVTKGEWTEEGHEARFKALTKLVILADPNPKKKSKK